MSSLDAGTSDWIECKLFGKQQMNPTLNQIFYSHLLLKILVDDYFIRKTMVFNGIVCVIAHFADIDCLVGAVNVNLRARRESGERKGALWVDVMLFTVM